MFLPPNVFANKAASLAITDAKSFVPVIVLSA